MPDRYPYDIEDALHASDLNQDTALTHGIGVISGFDATVPGSNSLEIDVDAGQGWFGATSDDVVDFVAQTVTFDPDGDNPRKSVIYGDSAGDINVVHSDPHPPRPAGKTQRQTYRPAPPDLSGMDAIVLYEVWLPPNLTVLDGSYVTDRRDESRINVYEATTVSLNAEEITLEDTAGGG